MQVIFAQSVVVALSISMLTGCEYASSTLLLNLRCEHDTTLRTYAYVIVQDLSIQSEFHKSGIV